MKKQLNSKESDRIDAIGVELDTRFSDSLSHWYEIHKRDLPWRKTSDPYTIWISEVILQQTRVEQGRAYFDRFVARFPDVTSLADADEENVLKLWQGLGYYSRARNLHQAAKMVVSKHSGKFPHKYADILALKGIGDYTAAAIASFCFGQPYAVVDGNVYRVLSRVFAVDDPIDSGRGKKVFAQLAQHLLSKTDPGLHNQAIMEFGALQCVPSSPDCANCPVSDFCLAYANKMVAQYPVKEGKTKVRNRYLNYMDVRCGDLMYIHKREGKDIWQNLYELPLIETNEILTLEELVASKAFKELFGSSPNVSIQHVANMKHVLSHQIIYASFYKVVVDTMPDLAYLSIQSENIGRYPISRLVSKYLEKE